MGSLDSSFSNFSDFSFPSSGGEEEVDDEVLVNRALAAFKLAKARGQDAVDLPENEWEAWQRKEAMEREIERRVAERLEMHLRSASPSRGGRPTPREPMSGATGPAFTYSGSPNMAPAGTRPPQNFRDLTPPVTPHVGHLDPASSRPRSRFQNGLTPPQSAASSPNLLDRSRIPGSMPRRPGSFNVVAPYVSNTTSLGALSEPELLDLNSDDEKSSSVSSEAVASRRRRFG